jgi:hypothetical protein
MLLDRMKLRRQSSLSRRLWQRRADLDINLNAVQSIIRIGRNDARRDLLD